MVQKWLKMSLKYLCIFTLFSAITRGSVGPFLAIFSIFLEFFGAPPSLFWPFFDHFWSFWGHFCAIFGPFFDPRKIVFFDHFGLKKSHK